MGKLLRFRKAAGAENAAAPAPAPTVFRPRLPIPRTDARPSSNFPSDARPANGAPRAGKPDPEADRKRKLRRGVLLAALAIVVTASSAAAIFGERGYLAVRRGREEVTKLAAQVDETRERVRGLQAEVDRLRNDPVAIERIAREQLGYARPGEFTFLLGGEEPAN